MLSYHLNFLILGAAFLVVVPVLSLDVAMEFLGRVDMLKPDEVTLLQDMFIMAYNQEDEEAQGNGNGNKNGNGNGNGNNGNRRVSSVKIDNTNSVESSTLLLEESVTQSFVLMAQVSCDGCKHDSLFSTKAGNGTFKDHAKFGLDVEVFASRFNDAIATLSGYLPVSYLSALQQIESAPCGATDREYSLHEVAVSGQYALAKGIDEISNEDHRILQQVFLDTYNFLNTVSTSPRCDKLSRRVESVRDDDTTATRRRLMQPPRPGPFQNYTFHFSTGVACWYCDNNTGLFGNDAGRRLMPGVKMENNEEHHSQSGRSLGGAVDEKTYKKCTCPVHAGKFGPVPRQEFVFAFDDAIQLLQKQGLLASIDGVLDVIEG